MRWALIIGQLCSFALKRIRTNPFRYDKTWNRWFISLNFTWQGRNFPCPFRVNHHCFTPCTNRPRDCACENQYARVLAGFGASNGKLMLSCTLSCVVTLNIFAAEAKGTLDKHMRHALDNVCPSGLSLFWIISTIFTDTISSNVHSSHFDLYFIRPCTRCLF